VQACLFIKRLLKVENIRNHSSIIRSKKKVTVLVQLLMSRAVWHMSALALCFQACHTLPFSLAKICCMIAHRLFSTFVGAHEQKEPINGSGVSLKQPAGSRSVLWAGPMTLVGHHSGQAVGSRLNWRPWATHRSVRWCVDLSSQGALYRSCVGPCPVRV
jgi:hypothetical protein